LQREVEVKYARLIFGQYKKEGGDTEDALFRGFAEKFKDKLNKPEFSREVASEIAKWVVSPPEEGGLGYTHRKEEYDKGDFTPSFKVFNMITNKYNKLIKEEKEKKK